MITEDKIAEAITAIAPKSSASIWADVLTPCMEASEINTPHRAAAFLGQCAVESNAFSSVSESLYYTPQRMMQVWPSRFNTLTRAQAYAANPIALANLVYADRLGNGDEHSGDGYRFRGAGLIQLTGRENFTAFGETIGRSPGDAADFARTPPGAAASACWFWTTRGLNALADEWRITDIGARINGVHPPGSNDRRVLESNIALRVLQS